MIGIIDYGMGNILSVKNAFHYLGEEAIICEDPKELNKVSKIVLPGVGAFPNCMKSLSENGFIEPLNQMVLVKQKPILGICLGMQVMASIGYEINQSVGLNWFKSEVVKINNGNLPIKIPNIGWEPVYINSNDALFNNFNLNKNPNFYFVHSYYMNCFDKSNITSWYQLGDYKITSSIQKDNIFGTQFHPEKSSEIGLDVLINFLNI